MYLWQIYDRHAGRTLMISSLPYVIPPPIDAPLNVPLTQSCPHPEDEQGPCTCTAIRSSDYDGLRGVDEATNVGRGDDAPPRSVLPAFSACLSDCVPARSARRDDRRTTFFSACSLSSWDMWSLCAPGSSVQSQNQSNMRELTKVSRGGLSLTSCSRRIGTPSPRTRL